MHCLYLRLLRGLAMAGLGALMVSLHRAHVRGHLEEGMGGEGTGGGVTRAVVFLMFSVVAVGLVSGALLGR